MTPVTALATLLEAFSKFFADTHTHMPTQTQRHCFPPAVHVHTG